MNKVLYAEDSIASQAVMRRFLRGTCELVVVPTTQAALEILARDTFSLVITDFLFPEDDAMELIARIRREKSPTQMPIIVVSSSMDRVLLSRVLRVGANEAVAKPIDPVRFRDLITTMMTTPFVREQEHGVVGVCCFEWEQHSRFYQYCPASNVTISGSTRAEAGQRMLDTLSSRVAEGADLGATKFESVVTHVVPF